MITREKEKESIPNINWLQLLGLNNFTEEVLDLKKKIIILLVTDANFQTTGLKCTKFPLIGLDS
jgi:hypothetical protein